MNVFAVMVLPLLALVGPVDERAVTTMIAEVASTAPNTEVVTTADVNQLLELQGQKQAAGCADDSESCVAELATALGAELVIRGELGMLDGGRRLNITVLNTTRIGAAGVVASSVDDRTGRRAETATASLDRGGAHHRWHGAHLRRRRR
jgi:hypothetical protein